MPAMRSGRRRVESLQIAIVLPSRPATAWVVGDFLQLHSCLSVFVVRFARPDSFVEALVAWGGTCPLRPPALSILGARGVAECWSWPSHHSQLPLMVGSA